MRLVYFASVREAIGIDGEERDFPDGIADIGQCLDWLADQDARYAQAFADRSKLRFALDQTMAAINAHMTGATELAIFPPVTGG